MHSYLCEKTGLIIAQFKSLCCVIITILFIIPCSAVLAFNSTTRMLLVRWPNFLSPINKGMYLPATTQLIKSLCIESHYTVTSCLKKGQEIPSGRIKMAIIHVTDWKDSELSLLIGMPKWIYTWLVIALINIKPSNLNLKTCYQH